jgi:hypothetical protein
LSCQIFATLLGVLTNRHQKALQPAWAALAAAVAPDSAAGRTLQQLLGNLQGASNGSGDARFKAYVNLLMGLLTTAIQVRLWHCCYIMSIRHQLLRNWFLMA